jgi:magnesium chelatase accessory protein
MSLPGTGSRSSERCEIPGDWPNRETSRRVALSKGSLHVQRAGNGKPILLLHGTGSATHTWRRILPKLARDFDVIAPDLPGHGCSPAPVGGSMKLENMAAALTELLRVLEVHPVAIIGHSAGAAIALKLARRLGEPTPRILAINGAFEPFGGPLNAVISPLARTIAALPLLAAIASRRARDRTVVRRLLTGTGGVPDQLTVDDYRRVLTNERHVRATLRMMAEWDLRDLSRDLATLARRCYLLVGANDRAIPPEQAWRIKSRYPAIRLTELSGVGHLAHEEDPERCADWILAVLAKVGDGD